MKRTHLPLNGLRVFDAAARHLSFTRAADELAVTPAAVGQQIRALEDMLGVVLFRRAPKGLELTHEGAAGLAALRGGFLNFEEAVRAMQAGQSSQHLAIAAPRDFTSKWLLPRLTDYARANADINFLLIAHEGEVDFTQANLDLAIVYASDKGEHEGEMLTPGALVRITPPTLSFRATSGDTKAAKGVSTMLDSNGVIAWGGTSADSAPALRVADAGLALDAVMSGMGIAEVPALLAAADIAAGRVTEGEATPSDATYWLIAPLPQWRQKKVKMLVSALSGG